MRHGEGELTMSPKMEGDVISYSMEMMGITDKRNATQVKRGGGIQSDAEMR